MALDANNFRQVLSCLLSLESETRTKAEVSSRSIVICASFILTNFSRIDSYVTQEAFNNIPTERRVLFLLNSITDESLPEAEKQLACVLMRRLITNDFPEFYPKVCIQ